MKKIVMFLMATVLIVATMNAQSYVAPKFTDNTYVSLRYGVTGLMHPECNGFTNFGHSLAQQTELQFGKYVTPKFGVALDGVVSWDTFSCEKLNDYTVPFVTVSALAKYRFVDTNKFAFTAVTGPGWAHGFAKNAKDANDLMVKFQLEFAYKVTDRLAVEVVPELNYNLTCNGSRMQPYFDSRNAWYGLNVGVSYRLGKDFQTCPYTYTQGEVDRLNEQINELRAELAKKPTEVEVVKQTVVEKITKVTNGDYVVYFAKNSDQLDVTAKSVLDAIAGNATVKLVGKASPEGNAEYNKNLSVRRAQTVAGYLQNRGVKVVDVNGIGASEGASSNRVVVVSVQ